MSEWLKQKAVEAGKPVELLQTQKGVGYLTALVTFHTLGDVGRFNGRISRQVVDFAGLVRLKSDGGYDESLGSAGESLTARRGFGGGTIVEANGRIAIGGVSY